jgi:restriction endonuclease Mrr
MALPYDISEAMIQCFGKCFHYKDGVAAFMRQAGVNQQLIQKYSAEPKFKWARYVISDLNQTEQGHEVLRRLLTELCKLRKVPDENVPDRDAALDALRELKELAASHDLYVEEKKSAGSERQVLARQKEKIVSERASKLRELQKTFSEGLTSTNRQLTGYTLEDILRELFSLFDLDYRKPYRTTVEQIDGHVNFEGFDYLVEARWRKDQPTFEEINGFKGKVDSKLESTRGLFIAVQGVRTEVANAFSGRGSNLIIVDGYDLAQILEGLVDLREALKFKIEKAAQEGRAFVSLSEFQR